jgi:hypothetical protein
MYRLLLVACLAGLGGCATIIDGTTQKITLNTNPPGADCAINRDGSKIAEITSTPGSVKIEKTKRDITVSCSKPGFETATYFNKSGLNSDVFGNLIIGGPIGLIVDTSTGADNQYEGAVNVTMLPVSPSHLMASSATAPEAPPAVLPAPSQVTRMPVPTGT